MGTRYKFKCNNCGYKATVSGGLDCGMRAVVQTMICLECHKLVDVLVGSRGEVGAKTGDPEFDEELNLCPACNGNRLEVWPDEQPCPKCKSGMISGRKPEYLWD